MGFAVCLAGWQDTMVGLQLADKVFLATELNDDLGR